MGVAADRHGRGPLSRHLPRAAAAAQRSRGDCHPAGRNARLARSRLPAARRRNGLAEIRRTRGLEGTRSILFDATDCTGAETEALRLAAEWYAPAPALALMDFPRPEDARRARAAGAAAVLSKPVLIDDLCCEMGRLQETARTRRGTPQD